MQPRPEPQYHEEAVDSAKNLVSLRTSTRREQLDSAKNGTSRWGTQLKQLANGVRLFTSPNARATHANRKAPKKKNTLKVPPRLSASAASPLSTHQ